MSEREKLSYEEFGVAVREHRHRCRSRRAEVAEELLGCSLVARAFAHHEAVDGRLDGVGADRRVDMELSPR